MQPILQSSTSSTVISLLKWNLAHRIRLSVPTKYEHNFLRHSASKRSIRRQILSRYSFAARAVIRRNAGDTFVFLRDSTPAHHNTETVHLLRHEMPKFMSPEFSQPDNSADVNEVDYHSRSRGRSSSSTSTRRHSTTPFTFTLPPRIAHRANSRHLIYSEVGRFRRPLQVTVRLMLRDRWPVCLSVTLVYCGQTVGWIKMPLSTWYASAEATSYWMGIQLPPRNGAQQPPLFGQCLLWPNGRPSQLLLRSCLIRGPTGATSCTDRWRWNMA